MARQYMDVSHFRAPYKNWPGPMGADAPLSVQASAVYIDTMPGGIQVFKPGVDDAISCLIEGSSVLLIGDDDNVQLMPRTAGDPRESAVSWVNRKRVLNPDGTFAPGGKVICAGTSAGAYAMALDVDTPKFLKAVNPADLLAAASTPLMAVLNVRWGRCPVGGSSQASFFGSPLGMAALALAVVGGVVWFASKRRRHS